jgi:ribosomal protein L35AE/L33A
VNTQATDPRMIEALEGATSLQLYQLKSFIEGMLAEPRRGLAARANLHLGQAVSFADFRDGQMRRGKIIAMKDIQATVLEEGTKRSWKIPCVAIEPDAERHASQAPYEPPPEPVVAASKAREFNRGDTVTFNDREGRVLTGVIVRINQRTATIGIGAGGTWRVPFQMLRHVLDI